MEIKEYLKTIVDNGKKEDMDKLSNIFDKVVKYIRDYDKHYFTQIEDEIYVLAYGEKISKQCAIDEVNAMKPYGEKWSFDQAIQAGNNGNVDFDEISEASWYYTMNMMYNDYYDVLGNDTSTYIKMAKAFLSDIDAPDGNAKVYRYSKAMKKD